MPAAPKTTISITRPDDFHVHFRDGDYLSSVVAQTAAQFGRAIAMPNLRPPVVNTEQARSYRNRIKAALPEGSTFEPLMTLYLTDRTSPEEIKRAKQSGFVYGVKWYPAGATTNSESGVTSIDRIVFVMEEMEQNDLPLLVHAEVTDSAVDIFDREKVFIERYLFPISRNYPNLRIVLEHVSSAFGVKFVLEADSQVAATITPHHLLMNRNEIFAGGLNAHNYCLPVLKSENDRQAVMLAATSGSPKFFAGTDSAPHTVASKNGIPSAAGIYNAHAALELYAEAFDSVDKLDKLNGFTSRYGAQFYQIPENTGTVTLVKEDTYVPADMPFGQERVVPMRGGGQISWRVVAS